MNIFRLLVTVSCIAIAGCNGSSGSSTNLPSTPVTVQADPAANTLTAADSAAGDVIGQWFCAATEELDNRYVAYWNDAYQLEFKPDRTLIRFVGTEVSGTWWYTVAGVTVQWANGEVTEFRANVANRGGIADNSTHCLRALPPTDDDTGDQSATDLIPTYDCGNNFVVGFASNGRLMQDGVVTGEWRTFLGNGIGTPTPTADTGFTYLEFNGTRFTVVADILLHEFGEWSCFSIYPDGPLLPLLAPVP